MKNNIRITSAVTSLFYIGVAVIEFDPFNTSMLYVGRAMNENRSEA